jgi:F-type H+-transporting ATPase subunit delta
MADLSTVARPYARAVFDVAVAQGKLDEWSKALAAAALIVEDPTAHAYLGRPALGADERTAFLADLCGRVDDARLLAADAGRNLLGVLSENDRLEALGEISVQFDALKARRENRVKVTIVAAAAVDPAQAEVISVALRRKLGREVELEIEVDPSLVGGAVIRAQDMVIDGSVQTRLKRLASALID